MGTAGATGRSHTDLYIEDLLRPAARLMMEHEAPFFAAFDDVPACSTERIQHSFIERVEFGAGTPPAITVTASYGEAASGRFCAVPEVKRYRMEFVFDGRDYKPTAASAEAARLFSLR